ncbi:hypothetical protein CDL15_Pgr006581 [Punica granatum]|uniref:Uncharacterized protein n=1 Tax=Punica granatum TaxID=22663 RepID=A0A218XZM5_PUNGR|nr:hypothetical protein CDL15_Pgr006581 [Punica granatum]
MEKLKVDQIVDTTSREANFWPERWIIVSVLSSLSDTLWSLIRIEGWQASPEVTRKPPPIGDSKEDEEGSENWKKAPLGLYLAGLKAKRRNIFVKAINRILRTGSIGPGSKAFK